MVLATIVILTVGVGTYLTKMIVDRRISGLAQQTSKLDDLGQKLDNLENNLLQTRKAQAELILTHHTQMCELFTAISYLIQGTDPGQSPASIQCPFIDKYDPEDIKCKNENNSTGKCKTEHCPFIS